MKQPDHDYAAVLEPEWDDLTVCYTETDLWIPVRVSNVSGRAWQTNGTSPTRLSYHWYDASGALWVRDGVRTPLGLEFAPGTSRDARIRVVVPEKPGPATLAITLLMWIATVVIAYVWHTQAGFWVAANLAGLCLGASQSGGRALVGILSPRRRVAEFYGLWGLVVRLAGVVGPLLYGFVTWVTAGNHRLALLLTGAMFVIGLVLLARVNVTAGERAAEATSV